MARMADTTAATELRYRSAPSRRRRIQELVQEQGYCTTVELAVAFDVHGGASLVGSRNSAEPTKGCAVKACRP